MRLYKALNTEVLHNKEFPMNSIILELDNKCILISSDFYHKRKYALKVYIWLPYEKKWVYTYAKNQYTEMMWDCYRKHQQKKSHDSGKYENMMRHERKHKTGGQEVEDHVFITEVLQIMNAQKILFMILEDVIIRLEVKITNE